MKSIPIFLTGVFAATTMISCSSTNTAHEQARNSRYGHGGTDNPPGVTQYQQVPVNPAVNPTPAPPYDPVVTQPTPPPEVVSTPAPPVVVKNYPYGKPVPGKPGFVFSPYSESSGYIDVRDIAPGTEVRDPYNPDKIFLVP